MVSEVASIGGPRREVEMPELPEVERGRKLVEAIAGGRRIAGVWCADDRIVFDGVTPVGVQRALTGARVEAVRRRGKHLWLELDRALHPLFHFGMTGGFRTRGDAPILLAASPRKVDGTWPPRFTKLRLELDDGGELAFTNARRLGRIRLRECPADEPPISLLGFDPLLDPPGPAAFTALLGARSAVIKSLLLDQRFAAGVGNWIADEVLYQAGIDPRRRADTLSPVESRRVRSRLLSVIRRAVEVDAVKDRFPRTWLFHRRWGKKDDARTARGEPIEFLTIGGRTTAWVPTRQG